LPLISKRERKKGGEQAGGIPHLADGEGGERGVCDLFRRPVTEVMPGREGERRGKPKKSLLSFGTKKGDGSTLIRGVVRNWKKGKRGGEGTTF